MEKRILEQINGGTRSLIFFGSDLQSSYEQTKKLAQNLEISEFDMIEIEAESEKNSKGEIKIVTIRELIRQINLTPAHGRSKLAIIKDADRLNLEAANALLKTLEEPPASAVIILLSADLKLLPTIKSRCQIVRLEDRSNEESREIFSDLKDINLKKVFTKAEKMAAAENLPAEIDKLIAFFRSQMLENPNEKIIRKLKLIIAARKNLNLTTNKRLVMENLLMRLL